MKQPSCSPKILVYAGWVIGFCALMALAYGTALLMLETFIK